MITYYVHLVKKDLIKGFSHSIYRRDSKLKIKIRIALAKELKTINVLQ